jgi:hypothetical protein
MFYNDIKYEHIFEFLAYDFLYTVNNIFCSKTKSKEVIEHWKCDLLSCTLGSIIGKISFTGSCLEQTWERTS